MASLRIASPAPMSKVASVSITAVEPPTPPLSPPLPTPRTISELISQRAKQLPNEPILGYPSRGTDYDEFTFAQLEDFSARASRRYAAQLPVRASSLQDKRVVALLGPSNLDYVVTALALTRLGFTVLFLSTRLSEAAYESLLNATTCRHIVVDTAFQRTATALRMLSPDLQILDIVHDSTYKINTPTEGQDCRPSSLNLDEETKKICWIIHSSGSTGLPKPIYQTHHAALRNYEQNMNMRGFITLPLFHAHGLSSVFRAITSVKKIYLYNANLPLTSQNLLIIMRQHKFEIFYGVPYALKLLSESEEGIEALAAMKVVMFGGSACPDSLGDQLVQGGVNLISHYGTTETGQLMTSFRPAGDKAWNYVRVHEKLEPYVRWENRGANLYELVVLSGWPSKVATNRPDGAYATKDLFEPHPSIMNAWKYSGRLDDTIVLDNGEKAIPIAMEQAVRRINLVREAIMFGTGKSQLGMMIIASEAASELQPKEVVAAVWPTIEAENRNSPAYAQLSPDMIRVLPAGTVYPQTDKGTIIRQAFYRTFQDDIEEVYKQLESASAGTLVFSDSELRAFLRTQILKLIPGEAENVSDDTDLFSLGLDSLQSTRLRASIVKKIQLNGNPLPQNVVFEYPTIAKLADALLRIRDSKASEAKDVTKEMAKLVAKYGTFPKHVPCTQSTEGNCVIVTGATGSLGAHLVAQLVKQEDVTEVCCLVRAASMVSAQRRVVKSLQERALYHSLPLSARRKITCYPSTFSDAKLGLDDSLYERICQKITTVIHCAWSVNFNKSLSSFEADCIAGARNLMLLCLSARQPMPASFNFCSSVSTVANTPGTFVPEALPESFACAQGMGYAQSKLVTENLVAKAAAETGMQARVLRVGQIIADTTHGIWNDTEAIPLMLRAATTIGALPALDESPRWLPVDVVATAVMDASLSSTSQTVLNIVNPKTFHWTRDLLPALRSAGLSFKEVSQREWIRLLRASNPDPVANPTIKLVDFFASKYDNDTTARKSLDYITTAAESLSPVLSSTPALSQPYVKQFIQHFLRTSWASPSPPPSPTSSQSQPQTRLIILSGPAGAGKSTVAAALAARLNRPSTSILEGDAVHDVVAIKKMSTGTALDPLDRAIWLLRLKAEILERVRAAREAAAANTDRRPAEQQQAKGEQVETILLTCSALRRAHRDVLRDVAGDGSVETRFVMLQAGEGELVRRVAAREGHYMKAGMVKGQLDVLEEVGVEETDVLPVDAEGDVEGVVEGVVWGLGMD